MRHCKIMRAFALFAANLFISVIKPFVMFAISKMSNLLLLFK